MERACQQLLDMHRANASISWQRQPQLNVIIDAVQQQQLAGTPPTPTSRHIDNLTLSKSPNSPSSLFF
jgi:hypothetical protein